MSKLTVAQEVIEQKIYLIRGQRVMLSADLADLYGITVKVLIQAVKRNADRFPEDFMFQLTHNEFKSLRSQFVTLKSLDRDSSLSDSRRGKHSKYLPYAFTEQGVAMLSSVLRSKKAIQVNIAIMRAFVKLRQIIYANKELAQKLKELERRMEKHDTEIHAIFEAIRQLMAPPDSMPKRRIGFHP
jgi:phage regulator Rha-like protein